MVDKFGFEENTEDFNQILTEMFKTACEKSYSRIRQCKEALQKDVNSHQKNLYQA